MRALLPFSQCFQRLELRVQRAGYSSTLLVVPSRPTTSIRISRDVKQIMPVTASPIKWRMGASGYSGPVRSESLDNPVAKAVWFIESHFKQEITLDDAAAVAGVSRYHLSRLFGLAVGCSFIRYLRGRRLTEAARALADAAPDILSVAIDTGYGSHEAFTRAFRDQFGLTPELLRASGSLEQIQLMEPIRMDETLLTTLEPPRFETRGTFLVAGLSERYDSTTSAGIPAQWPRFAPYLGNIPGQVGRTAYGVLCNSDDEENTDYISGVEVAGFSHVQPELARLRIPGQQYAVFVHRDHVSAIRRTWFTIFNQWLPAFAYRTTGGPEFERYGPEFDPRTGMGGFEIWIPVSPST